MISADEKAHSLFGLFSVNGKTAVKITADIRERNDEQRRIPDGLGQHRTIALINANVLKASFVTQSVDGKSPCLPTKKNDYENAESNQKQIDQKRYDRRDQKKDNIHGAPYALPSKTVSVGTGVLERTSQTILSAEFFFSISAFVKINLWHKTGTAADFTSSGKT